jgi:nitroimidazol reductase NimA-like FMN-containing flavoprotein (pyridoxamine 5'-phosphate oxidase superfamily)
MTVDLHEHRTFLTETKIPVRLSCTTESGWPVVLSLWYMFHEGNIWCATQETARVVRYLEHDPRCALEIAGDRMPYCGLRGQARAAIDPERGPDILERLLERYLGGTESPLAEKLLAKSETEVALILTPVNLFTWDFTPRMKDSLTGPPPKNCP